MTQRDVSQDALHEAVTKMVYEFARDGHNVVVPSELRIVATDARNRLNLTDDNSVCDVHTVEMEEQDCTGTDTICYLCDAPATNVCTFVLPDDDLKVEPSCTEHCYVVYSVVILSNVHRYMRGKLDKSCAQGDLKFTSDDRMAAHVGGGVISGMSMHLMDAYYTLTRWLSTF